MKDFIKETTGCLAVGLAIVLGGLVTVGAIFYCLYGLLIGTGNNDYSTFWISLIIGIGGFTFSCLAASIYNKFSGTADGQYYNRYSPSRIEKENQAKLEAQAQAQAKHKSDLDRANRLRIQQEPTNSYKWKGLEQTSEYRQKQSMERKVEVWDYLEKKRAEWKKEKKWYE